MPLFHRRGPDGSQVPPAPPPIAPVDPAAAEADLQAALAALEAGGIPPKAQRRLAELRHATAEGEQTLFTSDLSVGEFALLTRSGLRPVSQVMGSSVYHVGWQGMPGSYFGMGRGAYELGMLSEAWNNARRLALSRLQQEARLAGADAVVAVRVQWGAHDFASHSVEMVAMGTAVRTVGDVRTDPPVLTDLSGQDLYQLLAAGYRPTGVVGATTIFYVVPQWGTQRLQSSWGGQWTNAELPDFTQSFYSAREVAFGKLAAEAHALGSTGVVGVNLRQQIQTREVDTGGGSHRTDLIITLHVLGTGITEAPGTPTDVHIGLNLSA